MSHDVFISHSSKDKSVADAVCSILEQHKIRCWIAPRDVIPGKSYAACITQAIKSSIVLVMIFSKNSNTSRAVTSELEIAMNHDVVIIPFRIEDIEPSDEFEFYLGSRHWLDALTKPLEQHIIKLKDAVLSFVSSAKKNIADDESNGSDNLKLATSVIKPVNNNSYNIKVGDYILFGNYNDQPILWRCFHKKDAYVVLISEYVLCLKAYDAAESEKAEQGDTGTQRYGSNAWFNSNIREWLNSKDINVKYSTQPPTRQAVSVNHYNDEAGFLSNFSQAKINMIAEYKHDDIEDLVYLLSEQEVISYFGNVEKNRIKSHDKSNYSYWLRSPCLLVFGKFPYTVATITSEGKISHGRAYDGEHGVIPAINLSIDTCKSGNGTKENPYKLI